MKTFFIQLLFTFLTCSEMLQTEAAAAACGLFGYGGQPVADSPSLVAHQQQLFLHHQQQHGNRTLNNNNGNTGHHHHHHHQNSSTTNNHNNSPSESQTSSSAGHCSPNNSDAQSSTAGACCFECQLVKGRLSVAENRARFLDAKLLSINVRFIRVQSYGRLLGGTREKIFVDWDGLWKQGMFSTLVFEDFFDKSSFRNVGVFATFHLIGESVL